MMKTIDMEFMSSLIGVKFHMWHTDLTFTLQNNGEREDVLYLIYGSMSVANCTTT